MRLRAAILMVLLGCAGCFGYAADTPTDVSSGSFSGAPTSTFSQHDTPTETRAQARAHSSWNHLSLVAGPVLVSADQTDTAVTLGLRGDFLKFLSAEVGGILPGNVTDGFRKNSVARVTTLAEFHLSLQGEVPVPTLEDLLAMELGGGASMMQLTDEGLPPSGAAGMTAHVTSWSPQAIFGLRLLPKNPYLSILLLVAYAHYDNRFVASGQNVDLSFTGWMVRPLFQLKF